MREQVELLRHAAELCRRVFTAGPEVRSPRPGARRYQRPIYKLRFDKSATLGFVAERQPQSPATTSAADSDLILRTGRAHQACPLPAPLSR